MLKFKQGLQSDAATLLNVSRSLVQQAHKLREETDPVITKAVDAGEISIAAALPLAELPKDVQRGTLKELRHEAGDKRPTAPQARAAVSRVQVVATVKEQLAEGKTAKQAVSYAFQQHEITVPTPALADAVAQATNRQVLLPATDGLYHDGRTKAEEAVTMAQTKRLFQLFEALQALATLLNLESLVTEIPDYCAYRVDDYLDEAWVTLEAFRALWKGRDHVITERDC